MNTKMNQTIMINDIVNVIEYHTNKWNRDNQQHLNELPFVQNLIKENEKMRELLKSKNNNVFQENLKRSKEDVIIKLEQKISNLSDKYNDYKTKNNNYIDHIFQSLDDFGNNIYLTKEQIDELEQNQLKLLEEI